jgi:photosystem II stability/assembly factor-like uncharacterized protein
MEFLGCASGTACRGLRAVSALALVCSTASCGAGDHAAITSTSGAASTRSSQNVATGSGSGTSTSSSTKPPAHVVGNCSGLAAVDKFENITPPNIDLSGSGITNMLVDPVRTGTIFAGTDHQGLFKSTDCGSTWTKINTGQNGAVLDSGLLWSMDIDPVNPDTLYAGSLYGTDPSLLKSTNGGVDWASVMPPGSPVAQTVQYNFFQDLSLDPTNPQHIVVTFHAPCMGQYAPSCMAQTMDGGNTWQLFLSATSMWEEGAGPLVLGPTTWLLGTTVDGVFYTSDSGGHWEKVAPFANRQMYRTQDQSAYYLGGPEGLYTSPDAHVWTAIANSPAGFGIIGDGKRLFTSLRTAGTNQQPYFTSAESDGMTWVPYTSPNMAAGAVYLRYDADHHLLYSANTSSGLWRVVTQ